MEEEDVILSISKVPVLGPANRVFEVGPSKRHPLDRKTTTEKMSKRISVQRQTLVVSSCYYHIWLGLK